MHTLFIGNSYTFYFDVPLQVQAIAMERGRRFSVETLVEGGAGLETHLQQGALEVLQRGVFSDVVLQNRSHEALLQPARFVECGTNFIEAVQKLGARPLLYQTWAWHADQPSYGDAWTGRSPEAWLQKVKEAYDGLAKAHGLEVARVGEAWARCLAQHPEIRLHDEDLIHASAAGAHLAALVIAQKFRLKLDALQFIPEGVTEKEAHALRDVARWAA